MSPPTRRREERKWKRVHVRYGAKAPEHKAVAMQLTTRGLFLSANDVVFAQGSRIVVEFTVGAEVFLVGGVVRHAYRVPPHLRQYSRPGMGVELVDPPEALRAYLASL